MISYSKSQTRKPISKNKDRLVKNCLKPEILLIGVFILALSIRFVYLNQIISTPIFHGLAVDSEKYESFAFHILKGNLTHKDFIYLNAFYPFFLALIYLIFGYSHLSVALIQGIMDSLSCILIYYIASAMFNKRVGIISAFIYACYGIAIFYTGILLAPTVIIFFTLLFIASLIAAEKKGGVIIFFISGILFGFATLARPNLILFLIFLPVWFFTILKNKLGIKKSIYGFLLLLIGFFTVSSLIAIRNYAIEKRFTLSSLGGINFYIGNNPRANGRFMAPHGKATSPIEEIKTSIYFAEKELGKGLTPSQASRYWLLKGLAFIRDNPLDALLLYMKKFALFWRKEEIGLNIDYSLDKSFAPIFQLPFISFGIIAPLAILGIILCLKGNKNILLILFIFSYMISVIIFFISARYRLPILPFLIISSSYTLDRFLLLIRGKELKSITILATLFVLVFMAVNKNFEYFKYVASSRSKIDYNNLGRIYTRMGRLEEAISELKKALSIDPNFVGALCNLGIAYSEKGLIKEAIYEYKKALKIEPDHPPSHTYLGNAYFDKGRLEEALLEYRKALSINPDFAEAHNSLGLVYAKKGRLEEAILEYKKALAIDPSYLEAHTNLGIAYLAKGRLEEAISEHKMALAINPCFAKAHNNLAVAYYFRGDYRLAIEHCDQAIELGFRPHPQFLKQLELYR